MSTWRMRGIHGLFALLFLATGVLAGVGDADGDGAGDQFDVCCGTPMGVLVDEQGRPVGDLDLDCDVDMIDSALFWSSFTGPLTSQNPCEGGGDTENQCLMGTHNCHAQAYCTDTSSGFLCTCHEGYAGSGVNCQDINECDSNVCGLHGACTNYSGGYSCNCQAGYTLSDGTCADVNECDDEGLCGDAGDCVNQSGGYTCDCNSGFANCDGKPDCETALGNYSNTCGSATYLGAACGDSAAGFLCPETNFAFYTSRAGRGSTWYRVHLEECSDCCAYLEHRYRLTVPARVNYDLYVYSACEGTLEDSSTNATGLAEEVTPYINDSCTGGAYEGIDLLIEIRHVSGESCENWVLQIENRE